jgi:hypothetical protein
MDTMALRQRPDRQTLPLPITPDLFEQLHSRSHPLCDLPLELREARTVDSPSDGGGAKSSVHSGAKSDGRNHKLHNARAVLRDYRELGDALWDHFNVGRDEQLWYYRSLAEVFGRRSQSPLARELAEAVAELDRLVPMS